MKRFLIFGLLLVFVYSCRKIKTPWSPPPSYDVHKLDSNTIIGATNGIIGGYKLEPSVFAPNLQSLFRGDGFINTSVFNKSVNGGNYYEYLKSLIHDDLMPLKSATGHNIVITGGMFGETASDRTPDSDPLDRLRLYCLALKDSGWKVYVMTNPYQNPAFSKKGVGHGGNATLSGYDSSEFIERIAARNDSVRLYYSSYADGLIDIAANPRFAAFDSSYYQLNHVDLSDSGIDAVGKQVFEALKTDVLH